MSTTNRGLALIIIPCWNQITFTEQCIAALKTHTRRPWELIVIDNGSTDHTPDYLKDVRDGAAFQVRVITNARNRGFPVAINQGLKVARGQYLVLLNNDVVVTDGWLDQRVALANMTRQSADAAAPGAGLDAPLPPAEGVRCEHNPESPIGLVGPMSNYATPPQLVDQVPVKNEEKNIAHCLASVRGIFNEIVIIDTGSTDRTKEIGRSFGAKVIDFPWADSFAAARNEALQHATGDYAFWLDADDVVDPGQRETLLALLRSLKRDEPMAFVVRCACDPTPGSVGGETVVDYVRLFLERSLAGSAPTDSIVRKLYALIAKAHESLGESEAALRACADGLKLGNEVLAECPGDRDALASLARLKRVPA